MRVEGKEMPSFGSSSSRVPADDSATGGRRE